MNKIYYPTLNETLYTKVLDNGLEVYLLQKPGYEKTYALFGTRFGSIDNKINQDNGSIIRVEDGIAHFLEHKMFEKKDYSVDDLFSQMGASPNAFTSFTKTAYLFNTTEHINENIELLINYVQDLYLTEASVEKEKGIIIQEINMYADDADWRLYFGSIANLYHHHPVAIDIAGTPASVNNITKSALELCYKTFYDPSNMTFVAVGDFDAETVMNIIEENQHKKGFIKKPRIKRALVEEPTSVCVKEAVLEMDVAMPKYICSVKIQHDQSNKQKFDLAMTMLLNSIFSKSGDVYASLLEKGYINDTFSAEYTQEADYAFIQIGGDTPHPELLKQALYDILENLETYHVSEAVCDHQKKKMIGSAIFSLNQVESIAGMFLRYHFESGDYFKLVDIIAAISVDDLNHMKAYISKDALSSFTIMPKL